MYKFFKKDLDLLIQKRDDLTQRVRDAGQLVGETTSQSSETWHDNAPYDDAKLRFEQLLAQYAELDGIVRGAEIVEHANEKSTKASMGSTVRYQEHLGDVREVTIGSYIPADNSGVISYNAPLALILMGAQEGDLIRGSIAGREVSLNILKITQYDKNE